MTIHDCILKYNDVYYYIALQYSRIRSRNRIVGWKPLIYSEISGMDNVLHPHCRRTFRTKAQVEINLIVNSGATPSLDAACADPISNSATKRLAAIAT